MAKLLEPVIKRLYHVIENSREPYAGQLQKVWSLVHEAQSRLDLIMVFCHTDKQIPKSEAEAES